MRSLVRALVAMAMGQVMALMSTAAARTKVGMAPMQAPAKRADPEVR